MCRTPHCYRKTELIDNKKRHKLKAQKNILNKIIKENIKVGTYQGPKAHKSYAQFH